MSDKAPVTRVESEWRERERSCFAGAGWVSVGWTEGADFGPAAHLFGRGQMAQFGAGEGAGDCEEGKVGGEVTFHRGDRDSPKSPPDSRLAFFPSTTTSSHTHQPPSHTPPPLYPLLLSHYGRCQGIPPEARQGKWRMLSRCQLRACPISPIAHAHPSARFFSPLVLLFPL